MGKKNTQHAEYYSVVDRILIPHTRFQKALTRIAQLIRAMENKADPLGLAIVGESRTGKSRLLEHFESIYPPIRISDGLQVPFLRVKVPSKPTVKGLATLLLYHLGDPLYDTGTEIVQTLRLIDLLGKAGTKVIALDEFQHFYDKATSKVQHHVADWLKILCDDAHIALIVTGLPSCNSVIQQNEQLAGRFLAPVRLPRFDWTIAEDRADFIGILSAMADGLSMFNLPNLAATAVAFRFYCATGGLIGYLTKLLKQAIWNALDAAVFDICLEDLSVAFKDVLDRDDRARLTNFDPFQAGFDSRITDDLMTRIRHVGTPLEAPIVPRRAGRSKSKPTISEVLNGSIR